jgi:hypothetical protein
MACQTLISKINENFDTVNLNQFVEINRNSTGTGLNPRKPFTSIKILNKGTQDEVAYMYVMVNHVDQEINISSVGRHKTLGKKGLGKVLMYIAACKAMELGYTISFRALETENNALTRYYNDLGFVRKAPGSKNYLTKPDVLTAKINLAAREFFTGGALRKKTARARAYRKTRKN